MKTIAIVLFILTYILIIIFQKWRQWIALASAVIFVAAGVLPLGELGTAIDWNILMMLAGTMGTVSLFIESKMPNRMSDLLLQKTPNVMWAVVALSLFAGVVSAFVDNVATVLMIAPVGLAIAKRLDISPVPLLVTISVSSNLQGAATLVGDTTSIMLGSYAGMDFMDFLFMDGKPSIFWAVELGALATVPVIMYLFRKEKGSVPPTEPTEVTDTFPSFLLGGNILLLIGASFIPGKPAVTNGLICLAVFLIGAVRSILKNHSMGSVRKAFMEIDYATLLLLTGCAASGASQETTEETKIVYRSLPLPNLLVSIPESYAETSSEFYQKYYIRDDASIIITEDTEAANSDIKDYSASALLQYQKTAQRVEDVTGDLIVCEVSFASAVEEVAHDGTNDKVITTN